MWNVCCAFIVPTNREGQRLAKLLVLDSGWSGYPEHLGQLDQRRSLALRMIVGIACKVLYEKQLYNSGGIFEKSGVRQTFFLII